jgi:hypothetical protein
MIKQFFCGEMQAARVEVHTAGDARNDGSQLLMILCHKKKKKYA